MSAEEVEHISSAEPEIVQVPVVEQQPEQAPVKEPVEEPVSEAQPTKPRRIMSEKQRKAIDKAQKARAEQLRSMQQKREEERRIAAEKKPVEDAKRVLQEEKEKKRALREKKKAELEKKRAALEKKKQDEGYWKEVTENARTNKPKQPNRVGKDEPCARKIKNTYVSFDTADYTGRGAANPGRDQNNEIDNYGGIFG
ncbi:hypothetical protein BC832DRAFT_594427 [Gaertneriomyces semiglobifer]|nr:hypothetical protein BC832DRAFT_594427 [Gaertneriomyces semiglobifer]